MRTNFETLYSIDVFGEKLEFSMEVFENKIYIREGYYKAPIRKEPIKIFEHHCEHGRNPWEQAIAEAERIFQDKLKNGFTIICSGIPNSIAPLPMLAKLFKNIKKPIKYPVIVQPKLDGFRCIAMKKDGEISCWTRTGKRYETTHYIEKELFHIMDEGDIFDGELYNKGLNFQQNSSINKNKKFSSLGKFHVFDLINEDCQGVRLMALHDKIKKSSALKLCTFLVNHEIAKDEEDVMGITAKNISNGYEGSIVRFPLGKYRTNHRSSEMLKVKNFQDAEFKIINFRDGIGKERGLVIWECETKEGRNFTCRPSGSYEERRELFKIAHRFLYMYLTVKFFELTNDGIPRFPVGLGIRGDL